MSPTKPRFIIGHGLADEGGPHDAAGRRTNSSGFSKTGKGRAKCRCGDLSEVLETVAARKRWHVGHKAAVIAQVEQVDAGPVPSEPEATIRALADISYRGHDTGNGLARIFVNEMIGRGWTPPSDDH